MQLSRLKAGWSKKALFSKTLTSFTSSTCLCLQQMKVWGQNIQKFFPCAGKHSGYHYCCALYHDITTAVPAGLILTVRHSKATNSISLFFFFFVNVFTFAEPLMLNHFSTPARVNITDPGKQRVPSVTEACTRRRRRRRRILCWASPKTTDINEYSQRTSMKNKMKHWWNR